MEPAIFDEFLALEKHGNPWSRQHERRAQRRALLGEPAVDIARPDLFGHARAAVGDLIMRLCVDDALERPIVQAAL